MGNALVRCILAIAVTAAQPAAAPSLHDLIREALASNPEILAAKKTLWKYHSEIKYVSNPHT